MQALVLISTNTMGEAYAQIHELGSEVEVAHIDIVAQKSGQCVLLVVASGIESVKRTYPEAFVFEENLPRILSVLSCSEIGKLTGSLLTVEFDQVTNIVLFLNELVSTGGLFEVLEFRFPRSSAERGRLEISLGPVADTVYSFLDQDNSLVWHEVKNPNPHLKKLFY